MRIRTHSWIFGSVVLAAVAGIGASVFADSIDGDWCFGDGRSLSMQGPDIVTPGGTKTKGNYSRHAFNYTVPAKDPDAGATVDMVLMHENLMHMKVIASSPNATPGPVQAWRRCSVKTS